MVETDRYQSWVYVAHEFIEGINGRRKRHELNNHLSFGFRKDDVVLWALNDRWTNENEVVLEQLKFWMTKKLGPYLNHWESFPNRIKNDQIIRFMIEDLDMITRSLHQDYPKDPHLVCASIHEIKISVIFILMCYIVNNKGTSIPKQYAITELNYWKSRADEIVKNLFGDLNIPIEHQYKPLIRLVNEVNKIVSTHG